MRSQWYELKTKALRLRKDGHSIRSVEAKLRIPRSTLSGWFKAIVLSKDKEAKLKQEWLKGLVKARQKAALWHNAQKAARLVQAEQEAASTFKNISIYDKNVLDLAMAMLYLGEGFKSTTETAMGNSDPLILKFFISVLKKNYNFDESKIKCELHLRADQNPTKMKKYWSNELRLPLANFTSVSIDYRTKGSRTYSEYKGVCVLRCGTVAIQRKLISLYRLYCNSIIENYMRG